MGTQNRPIICNNAITYDFGKGRGTETIKFKGSYFQGNLLTRFSGELGHASMDKQGNISAKTVNTIFLNVCNNLRGQNDAAPLKALLDACTDTSSDGGELFTTKEQQKVMSILKSWTSLSWK